MDALESSSTPPPLRVCAVVVASATVFPLDGLGGAPVGLRADMDRARSLCFARRLFLPSLGMRRNPIPCCQCQSPAKQRQRYFCLGHSDPSKIKDNAQDSVHASSPLLKTSSLVFGHFSHLASVGSASRGLLSQTVRDSGAAVAHSPCPSLDASSASPSEGSWNKQKHATSNTNQAQRARRVCCCIFLDRGVVVGTRFCCTSRRLQAMSSSSPSSASQKTSS